MSGFNLFGFWLAVKDEASAAAAARMAGLPVLLMAGNSALLALMAAVQPQPPAGLLTVLSVFALVLTFLAFRIRAGCFYRVPHAFVLFIAFMGAMIFFAGSEWTVAGETPLERALFSAGWLVPIFCLALMGSGLRGWRWMRSRGIRLSA